MRLTLLLVPLLALACSSTTATPTDAGTTTDGSVPAEAGGPDAKVSLVPSDRTYTVTTPDAPSGKELPLVLLLHGYGVSGLLEDIYLGASQLARKRGFILVLPDGKVDASGRRYWNATPECCDLGRVGTDDVAFLRALLDEVQANHKVDKKRVFIVGHSNGGFMGYRLACELSDRIAGVASLAGAQGGGGGCKPKEPVAILQVHGTKDDTVPYEGGPLAGGGAPVLSAKATVAAWATLNGCGGALTSAGPARDFESTIAGPETLLERHACTKGAAELWTLQEGSHIPSFNDQWLPAVMDFLEAHPRP